MSNALTNPVPSRPDDERAAGSYESGPSALVRAESFPSGFGPPPADEGQPLAVTLRQYFHIVLKRRWLILSIAVVFTVLGTVQAFLKTPLYMAGVRVQIERESVKVVESGSTGPVDSGTSDFLRTQFELLKSRAMAERVASALHLADDASFFAPRKRSLSALLFGAREQQVPSPAARQSWAAAILASNMSVFPVPGSRLVDLSYVDTSPARAAQVANSYADAFIASNLDKRLEANSYAKTFLEDQIKQLKLRLEESEKALLDFAEREKLMEVTDKTSIAENNLSAANAALGQLISDRMKNEQLWRQVENVSLINLPQFLSNPVIEVLRGQRKALETEYQEKLENYQPGYPLMIQISKKIKEVA